MTLSIKSKLTLKSEIGIYFLKIFDVIKKSVGNVFDIFSDGQVEINFTLAAFWKMRELPFTSLFVRDICVGK